MDYTTRETLRSIDFYRRWIDKRALFVGTPHEQLLIDTPPEELERWLDAFNLWWSGAAFRRVYHDPRFRDAYIEVMRQGAEMCGEMLDVKGWPD